MDNTQIITYLELALIASKTSPLWMGIIHGCGQSKNMRIALTILAFLTIGNHLVKACKCKSSDSIKKEFEGTEMIVHGTVLSKTYVSYASTLSNEYLKAIQEKYKTDAQKLAFLESKSILKIELEVKDSYKGGLEKTIVIYTSKFGASCGYLGFTVGRDFITYLSSKNQLSFMYKKAGDGLKDNSGLWTNHCSRTREFDKNEHEELCTLRGG